MSLSENCFKGSNVFIGKKGEIWKSIKQFPILFVASIGWVKVAWETLNSMDFETLYNLLSQKTMRRKKVWFDLTDLSKEQTQN